MYHLFKMFSKECVMLFFKLCSNVTFHSAVIHSLRPRYTVSWKRNMDDSQNTNNINTNDKRLLLDAQHEDESSQMSHPFICNDIITYGIIIINNISN